MIKPEYSPAATPVEVSRVRFRDFGIFATSRAISEEESMSC